MHTSKCHFLGHTSVYNVINWNYLFTKPVNNYTHLNQIPTSIYIYNKDTELNLEIFCNQAKTAENVPLKLSSGRSTRREEETHLIVFPFKTLILFIPDQNWRSLKLKCYFFHMCCVKKKKKNNIKWNFLFKVKQAEICIMYLSSENKKILKRF